MFIRALLSVLFLIPLSISAQLIESPTLIEPELDLVSRFKFVPALTTGKTGFAYVQQQSDGSEQIHLAHLTAIAPETKANWHSQLASYDGYSEDVSRLSASPDNAMLRTYSVQLSSSFIDLNNRFYDMNTGEYLGLINEHRFSELNDTLHPSERLQEFREVELSFGVDAETVAAYDYSIDAESGNFELMAFQWNTDDTVSITYRFDVYNFGSWIGEEEFTINFTIDETGTHIESYGDIKTAQAEPLTFPLALDPSGYMTLSSKQIMFPITYHFGRWSITLDYPRLADIVEGNIPMRYQLIRY